MYLSQNSAIQGTKTSYICFHFASSETDRIRWADWLHLSLLAVKEADFTDQERLSVLSIPSGRKIYKISPEYGTRNRWDSGKHSIKNLSPDGGWR